LKILVVRLRLIGDVVFTTPVIRGLRRHFPQAHLTYLVEPAAAPVVHGHPDLDEVVVVPHSRGRRRLLDDLRLAWQLRRSGYDIAIDMHGGPRSAWLTLASGAPKRIGYTIAGRQWMYTDIVERTDDLAPRHSVENQWDLLDPLGVGPCNPIDDPVAMAADADAAAAVAARCAAAGITSAHRVVVLHVSAGNPFRRWPEESFVDVIVHLARQNPARRFVVTSGPSDAAAATRIMAGARARLGAAAHAMVDPGDLTLAELRALVVRAAVYIGGDSGPAHIAATTATPIVELLGPTLPERSRPWRDPRWFTETVDIGPLACRPCHQRVCVPGDFRCLRGIQPGQVIAAVERALASHEEDAGKAGMRQA